LVRKISFGEGVERTFATFSPVVGSIKVVRSGKVRRAKLYYLRDRAGKSARISEKIKKRIGIDLETKVHEVNEESVLPDSDNQPKDNLKTDTKVETSKVETRSEDKIKSSTEKKTEDKKAEKQKENTDQKK